MDLDENKAPSYKVIMLGNSTVGKTSILTQLCTNIFNKESTSTIGGNFVEKEIQTKNGLTKLQLWDTAGQEQYRCLVPIYSRGASAAVIVFDVTQEKSFDTADEWLDLVKRNKSDNCLIFAVANKIDLEPTYNIKVIEEWANAHGAYFFKASATDLSSVEKVFKTVAEELNQEKYACISTGTLKVAADTKKGCC